MSKKEDELFISRLCRDVRSAKMPDIWEDREAVEDFEHSFKQSFDYESHKHKSNNRLFHILREYDASDDSPEKRIHDWLIT